MDKEQTITLLQECNAGSKMGVTSIDEVLEKVQDHELKRLLQKSKKHHEEIGNQLHSLLNELGSEEKDPPIMAKWMSWMETNIKLGMDNSDEKVAELVTDGCDMGIKTLYKVLNKSTNADAKAKNICNEIITIEEDLEHQLRKYL